MMYQGTDVRKPFSFVPYITAKTAHIYPNMSSRIILTHATYTLH